MVCEVLTMIIATGVAVVLSAIYLAELKLGFFRKRFRTIDRNSLEHGGSLVAQVIKAHGVRHVFTLCGGHISPILVALEKIGVKVVDTRHEATAVFAADATARMSGTVGVAIVTAGPGLTNTITAVKNAEMAESPIVIIGGAAASILKGRGALQDIDQMSLFKPLCKFCGTVTAVREIVPVLRKAFQIAQSGTPGPVFLEFPIDCLFPYNAVVKEIGMKSGGKSLSQKLVDMYLQNYVDNIFNDAWVNKVFDPLRVDIPLAGSTQVMECVQMIRSSARPLIVLGSQVTLPPVPIQQLRKALEAMGIPCYLGGMARGLLGRNSSIQMRQKRREALQEADLVILAGAVCDFRLSYGRVLSKKSKIVAVNRNKTQLYKNSDMFWKPSLAIQSDAASFIIEVAQNLNNLKVSSKWIETLTKREVEKEDENKKLAEEKTENHLNPIKILQKLEEVMGDDAILVADGGDFVATAAYTLRPRGPLQWLDPGAFGTLGVGGGFALGAKLCRPESEVWIIYGDGSCGYSIMEYDTYDRHNAPILSLVGNDGAWMQIARDQTPRFKTSIACMLKQSNYHEIVEVFGAKGFLLRREDDDKIKEVLEEARKFYQSNGRSVMVNALIGQTKFRDGSISV
ncbi:hypothetical protein CHUAL_001606 [Chamberlinius hualienensis]